MKFLLPILAVVTLSTVTSAKPIEQHIYVRAYGCPFSGAKTVDVFIQSAALFGPLGRHVHVAATETADKALLFNFIVAAGPLDINFSIDGQACTSGGGGFVVLPGHDRHLLISMEPSLFVTDWHARKFFAGTLSASPVSIAVVASKEARCPDLSAPGTPAVIDDGAYYVGYVEGQYTFLKIQSAGLDTLYIALPAASPVESNNQYVRRDISLNDLRALTTHGLNNNRQCISSPTGISSRFDQ